MELEPPSSPRHAPLHPPLPRPRSKSAFKCALVTCFLFGLSLACLVTYAFYAGLRLLIRDVSDPHRGHFHPNASTPHLLRPSGRGELVWPLFDEQTRFDVVLGVWLRDVGRAEGSEEKGEEGDKVDGANGADEFADRETALLEMIGVPAVQLGEKRTKERNLFEGVVFRDVGIEDKGLDTTVTFELPLESFHGKYIFSTDLQATVSLVPTNMDMTSLLASSGWRPDEIQILPRLSDQYKQSSSSPPTWTSSNATPAWNALDLFAASFSMISLELDPARCPNHQQFADEQRETGQQSHPITEASLKRHPYVTTRSHVYMVKETRPFDRKTFEQKHSLLKKTSCGQSGEKPIVSRSLCRLDYQTTGHWGTKFTFPSDPVSDTDPAPASEELKYGPFLSVLKHSAGPKDSVPLPLIRPICLNDPTTLNATAGPDSIDVTYHFRFSTLTPGRIKLLDEFITPPSTSINVTDRQAMHDHDSWEQLSGLLGNKAVGTHPYRRLIISAIKDFLLIPISLLTILYWYTRQTTAGLSLPASALLALSTITDNVGFALFTASQPSVNTVATLFNLLIAAESLAPVPFVVKLIMPVELSREGGKWGLRRKRWSHRERNSRRVGEARPLAVCVGIFLATWLIPHFLEYYNYNILSPPLPPLSKGEPGYVDRASYWTQVYSLAVGLRIFAAMMQMRHNHLAKTFAGTYKLTAWLVVVRWVLELVYHTPIVGRYEVGEGLGYRQLLEVLVGAGWGWQAWKYGRVEQEMAEGDEGDW